MASPDGENSLHRLRFLPLEAPLSKEVNEEARRSGLWKKLREEKKLRYKGDAINFLGEKRKRSGRAFWLQRGLGGGYILNVSIIDAASLIEVDSLLDVEAYKRALHPSAIIFPSSVTSVQLNMPEGQRRPTITVSIPLDDNLQLGRVGIERDKVKNRGSFQHKDVDRILEDDADEFHAALSTYLNLALRLQQRRVDRNALVFFDPKNRVEINEAGFINHLHPAEAYHSALIPREFSFLANEAIAQFFIDNGIQGIFSNQLPPSIDFDRETYFREIYLAANSSRRGDINDLREMQKICLQPSIFSIDPKGHYGLSLPYFLRATAPGDRYTDLVNQRMLGAFLVGEKAPYDLDQLHNMSEAINEGPNRKQKKKIKEVKEGLYDEVRQGIESGELRRFTPKDFSRLVRVVAREGITHPAIEDIILKRGVSPKDYFNLVFAKHPDSEEWELFRGKVISSLKKRRRSRLSSLVFQVAHRRLQWSEIEYTETLREKDGATIGFYTVATIIVGGKRYTSENGYSTTSKGSRDRANADLLYKILENI